MISKREGLLTFLLGASFVAIANFGIKDFWAGCAVLLLGLYFITLAQFKR